MPTIDILSILIPLLELIASFGGQLYRIFDYSVLVFRLIRESLSLVIEYIVGATSATPPKWYSMSI